MSMCWYFHSFPLDQFRKVFGSGTKAQEDKFVKSLKDPIEGFQDVEDRKTAIRLAKEMLHNGISYREKEEEEKEILDELVTRAFHPIGLATELKVRPMSAEPVTLAVAEELIRHGQAARRWLLALFANGWRFGEDEPPEQPYFILMPDQIAKLKSDLEALVSDESIRWRFPEVPEITRRNIIEVVDEVIKKKDHGLFAQLG